MKNRQLVNQVKLKEQAPYPVRQSSSKGRRMDNEVGYRSNNDKSEMFQSVEENDKYR